MLSEEDNEKMYKYYVKSSTEISKAIFSKMVDDGSNNVMTINELLDFSSSTLNKFTETFVELMKEEENFPEEPSDLFVEQTKNVFREALLILSAENDFMPNESLVNYCCRTAIGLMVYTENLKK